MSASEQREEPGDPRVVGTAEDPPQSSRGSANRARRFTEEAETQMTRRRRSIEPDKNPRNFRPRSVALGDGVQNSGTVRRNFEFSFSQQVAVADRPVPSVQPR